MVILITYAQQAKRHGCAKTYVKEDERVYVPYRAPVMTVCFLFQKTRGIRDDPLWREPVASEDGWITPAGSVLCQPTRPRVPPVYADRDTYDLLKLDEHIDTIFVNSQMVIDGRVLLFKFSLPAKTVPGSFCWEKLRESTVLKENADARMSIYVCLGCVRQWNV